MNSKSNVILLGKKKPLECFRFEIGALPLFSDNILNFSFSLTWESFGGAKNYYSTILQGISV